LVAGFGGVQSFGNDDHHLPKKFEDLLQTGRVEVGGGAEDGRHRWHYSMVAASGFSVLELDEENRKDRNFC
jgi:hypothetical protein